MGRQAGLEEPLLGVRQLVELELEELEAVGLERVVQLMA